MRRAAARRGGIAPAGLGSARLIAASVGGSGPGCSSTRAQSDTHRARSSLSATSARARGPSGATSISAHGLQIAWKTASAPWPEVASPTSGCVWFIAIADAFGLSRFPGWRSRAWHWPRLFCSTGDVRWATNGIVDVTELALSAKPLA